MMEQREHPGQKKVQVGGLEFVCMHRTAGEDGGASIEIYGDVDGKPFQVLRFDMFQKGPHFHYAPGDRARNYQFGLDDKLIPRSVDWALEQIRDNIPEMLRIGGFKPLAERVDRKAFETGWTKVRDCLASTAPEGMLGKAPVKAG